MRCGDLIDRLEMLAPPAYACEWDNVGLLAGESEKEVRRVLLALDATDSVVAEAVSRKADLLITHHPLIFKPIKRVTDQDFVSKRVLTLIQNKIACYAMHTNFDAAPGCMADLAAGRLGLTGCVPLQPAEGSLEPEESQKKIGIGRIGTLLQPLSLLQLGERVKEVFGLPFLMVYGEEAVKGPLSRVAVCPGSGGSVIKDALKLGAEVLITGDISHHQGIDAQACGMAVLDAGHYGLEHIFAEFMASFLQSQTGGQVDIMKADQSFPVHIM